VSAAELRFDRGSPGFTIDADGLSMQLLVCIINQEEKLEAILAGFLELGVTGATVLRSEGMGRVLSQDIPVIANLQTLLSRSRPQNSTVLSVIESDETLEKAVALVQDICGDLTAPSTGILFTLPIGRVVGLAPILESDSTVDSSNDGIV